MYQYHSYLPSKIFIQSVLSVAIASILVGIVYFWPVENSGTSLEPQKVRDEAVQLIAANLEKDSDGDGLKDWEETLWKTNLFNKDTDGDGTEDGEEVKKGRNPATTGPNDKIETQLTQRNEIVGSTENPSSTDRLAQDIFAQYLLKKQQGSEITPADRQQIINSAITRSGGVLNSPQFTLGDIKTTGDSPDSYRVYGNALGKAIAQNLVSSENEAIIMKRALEENNPEELKKIDTIIDSYRKTLNVVLLVPAPTTIAQAHLRFINATQTIIDATVSMRMVFEDPVSALQAISSYQTTQSELERTLREIKSFFLLNKVFFQNSEYGSVITGKVQ